VQFADEAWRGTHLRTLRPSPYCDVYPLYRAEVERAAFIVS
jgi:hypothetical protein